MSRFRVQIGDGDYAVTRTVEAVFPDLAAEEAVEQYERENGEATIAYEGQAINATVKDDQGRTSRFEVHGSLAPAYYATEIHDFDEVTA